MRAEKGECIVDFRLLVCFRHELIYDPFKGLDIVIGLSLLDLDAESARIPQTSDGRWRNDNDSRPLDRRKPPLKLRDDPQQLLRFIFSFVPGLELNKDTSGVGLNTKGQDVQATQRRRMEHPGRSLGHMLD